MVRTVHHILLLLVCLVIAGCEVIREDQRLIALDPVSAVSNSKHHLLIEYTGVNCVNCPRAAETVHELEQIYPNLIVVAMHPASNPFTQAAAKYDYTCPEADVYYKFMGGLPTTPFPTGNLNFTADDDGNYLTDHTTWPTALRAAQQDTAVVWISVTPKWQDQNLHIRYTLTSLDEKERPVDVLLWVIENNIVGPQNMPNGTLNMEYTHQHMLRASLNGEQGNNIVLRPNENYTDEGTYTLSDKWVRANCRIVAVVLDHNTRQLLNAQSVQIN